MFNVRKVNENDLTNLQSIKPEFTEDLLRNRLNDQLKNNIEFRMLFSDNLPVCFVVMSLIGKATHPEYPDLSDLYTKEDRRGEGFGKYLIKYCEIRAKELGFKKIGLAVNPNENPKALSLYKRLGFISTAENQYLDGIYNGVEDWVIDLEKML